MHMQFSLNKRHICTNGAHDFLFTDLVRDFTDCALVTIGEILKEFNTLRLNNF